MYYIYIVRCSDNSLYTGITNDLERRYQEHVSKSSKAAKYTKRHQVVSLQAAWTCSSRSLASRLEYWIKKLPKDKKEEIIINKEKMKIYLSDKLDVSLFCRLEKKQDENK